MKLMYWKCLSLDDADVYSIREKTRKEAKRVREELGVERFGPPTKVVLEYKNGFDLMQSCLGENRGIELMVSEFGPEEGP
jgi:hypothetical protein